MNNKEIIKASKKRFKKHYILHVTVKDDADSLPVKLSPFTSIIEHSKDEFQHKNYVIHIHDKYLTIKAEDFVFEPVKLLFDDILWIELYYVFDVIDSKKDDSLKNETII